MAVTIANVDAYTAALVAALAQQGIMLADFSVNGVRTIALVEGANVLLSCEVRDADLTDKIRELIGVYQLETERPTRH